MLCHRAHCAALGAALVVISLALLPPLSDAQEEAEPQTLFTNVNVFDGTSDTLAEGMSVLIEGNLIKNVGKNDIQARDDATIIDGGGRTLMPGLADTHVHLGFASLPQDQMFTGRPGYNYIYSAGDAEAMLMRGFKIGRAHV